jgi:hypothetical protein
VTTTTTSAARRALDDHFRSFTTESKLPAFFTRALKLAIVCRYYAPAEDWHKTVIDHTIESVNNAYGPDAKLTIAIERVRETKPGFAADATAAAKGGRVQETYMLHERRTIYTMERNT